MFFTGNIIKLIDDPKFARIRRVWLHYILVVLTHIFLRPVLQVVLPTSTFCGSISALHLQNHPTQLVSQHLLDQW